MIITIEIAVTIAPKWRHEQRFILRFVDPGIPVLVEHGPCNMHSENCLVHKSLDSQAKLGCRCSSFSHVTYEGNEGN